MNSRYVLKLNNFVRF